MSDATTNRFQVFAWEWVAGKGWVYHPEWSYQQHPNHQDAEQYVAQLWGALPKMLKYPSWWYVGLYYYAGQWLLEEGEQRYVWPVGFSASADAMEPAPHTSPPAPPPPESEREPNKIGTVVGACVGATSGVLISTAADASPLAKVLVGILGGLTGAVIGRKA